MSSVDPFPLAAEWQVCELLLAHACFYGMETCLAQSTVKFSFKICAPKWVNCFLLTTLNLPARDGQLTSPLIFPGKELVIHHHVVAGWCARLGPGEERARLGLSNHEGARAGARQKQESQMPWLLPSSSPLTVLLLAKPGPKLETREPGEAGAEGLRRMHQGQAQREQEVIETVGLPRRWASMGGLSTCIPESCQSGSILPGAFQCHCLENTILLPPPPPTSG